MAEETKKAFTDHVDNPGAVSGARDAKKLNAAGLWPPVGGRGQEVIWNHKAGRKATPEEIASAMKLTVKEGETPAEVKARKEKEATARGEEPAK